MRFLPIHFSILILLISIMGCGQPDNLSGPSVPAVSADAAQDVTPEASLDAQNGSDAGLDAMDTNVEPACAPPTDSSTAAMCLRFEREVIDLIPEEKKFDGRGILIVQIFDTPLPEPPSSPPVEALVEAVRPDQSGGSVEMGVYDSWEPVRFEGLPDVVYVRALFVDNPEVFQSPDLAAGVWLGGWDFSAGLIEDQPLQPVDLSLGAGTEVSVGMTALRFMRVRLRKSMFAQPRGNGQGPSGFLLFDTKEFTPMPNLWGLGTVPCASIHTAAGIFIEGAFMGHGTYYGLGYLDDYGTGLDEGIPPGTMVNITLQAGQPVLPESAKIEVPPGAYRVEADLELTATVPFQSLPPADNVSCP